MSSSQLDRYRKNLNLGAGKTINRAIGHPNSRGKRANKKERRNELRGKMKTLDCSAQKPRDKI